MPKQQVSVEMVCSGEAVAALRDVWETMARAYDAKREQMRHDNADVPEGFVRNAKGWLLPVAAVKEKDMIEDSYVRDMHLMVAAVEAACRYLRLSAYSEADALVSMIVGDAGGDGSAARRSKVTLQSLDATRRVTIDWRETVAFGPEVAAAKDMVMACVRGWSAGAQQHLVNLAMLAFQTNSAGDLSLSKVASLWRMACDEPEWQQAMAALKESLRATGTTTYLRFHERQSPDGAWVLAEVKV